MKRTFGTLALAVVLAGCSSPSGIDPPGVIDGPIQEFGTVVFDLDYGPLGTAVPDTLVWLEPAELALSVLPLYDGRGHFAIEAWTVRGPMGEIDEPVTGTFGAVSIPTTFTAGQPASVRLRFRPTIPVSGGLLRYGAVLDSVLVDGVMHPAVPDTVEAPFASPPLDLWGEHFVIVVPKT